MGIPDSILLKKGQLTNEEWAVIREHPNYARKMLKDIEFLRPAIDIPYCHHEKWDGSGYPRRLAGEAIPLAARIFAVADVFDALSSKRPYKEPMGFASVMAILDQDTGSHFDPAVMAVFRPMAQAVFERLANSSEDDARLLLADRVRRHFYV
jgi:HD-GYP domain-containing protein (c-di-GMP phosphodiesterase class II)